MKTLRLIGMTLLMVMLAVLIIKGASVKQRLCFPQTWQVVPNHQLPHISMPVLDCQYWLPYIFNIPFRVLTDTLSSSE